jgi:uncharacterized membrane protein YdjX (TVP38/TMEM64 family)
MPSNTNEPLLGDEANQEGKKGWEKKDVATYVVAGAVVIGLIVLGVLHKDDLVAFKVQVITEARTLGYGAVAVVFFLCVLTTSVNGPSFVWEVSGGALLYEMYGSKAGLGWALLACCPGVWFGCIFAFLLGGRYLKPKVVHVIEEHEPLRIINEVIKEEGWPFAFMMRLNPLIPFEAMNLACSMTNLSLKDYAISCFGTMPVVAFEVYSAASAAAVAEKGGGSELVATIVKLSIGVVLIIGMALYAKNKYDKKKDEFAKNGKLAELEIFDNSPPSGSSRLQAFQALPVIKSISENYKLRKTSTQVLFSSHPRGPPTMSRRA